MATISNTGATPRTLSDYLAILNSRWLTAFGADFAITPETPAGQIIGIMALALAEADEAVINSLNSLDVLAAQGNQLRSLGTLFGVDDPPGTRSALTAQATGAPGTIIPAGSRASTLQNYIFETTAVATIDTNGQAVIPMQSVDEGAIPAPAGTLTRIVTLVSGWRTITNQTDAVLGALAGNDTDYRRRYFLQLANRQNASTEAIRTAALGAGARKVSVQQNDLGHAITRDGVSIAANSIMPVIDADPALDDALFVALADVKPLGIPYVGSIQSVPHNVRFQRALPAALNIAIAITATTEYPQDGETTIRQNLLDYAAGWAIGELPDVNRLYAPITRVPGFVFDNAPTLTVRRSTEFRYRLARNTPSGFIYQTTAANSAPATPAGNDAEPAGWSATRADPSATMPYLWVSTRTQNTAGDWQNWTAPALLAVHTAVSDLASIAWHDAPDGAAPTTPAGNAPTGWTVNAPVITTGAARWTAYRTRANAGDSWSAWSTPARIGVNSLLPPDTPSGDDPAGWLHERPAPTAADPYLWVSTRLQNADLSWPPAAWTAPALLQVHSGATENLQIIWDDAPSAPGTPTGDAPAGWSAAAANITTGAFRWLSYRTRAGTVYDWTNWSAPAAAGNNRATGAFALPAAAQLDVLYHLDRDNISISVMA